ncbi:uncharacterized protein LOC112906662 [Agrilus planipennis]|uniref:Uncharacterized protein LOC112906662 n=1 Tax=Agrilus planipennis TaxID=224129 RepID=A0A7F5RLX0_AGRPL|nr:uncharacterized protein LOC112906662 [Agrilus planipennis]
MAELCQWVDVQKVAYAKRLLTGSAKLFVRYEKCGKTWKSLKSALKSEFEEVVDSYKVHRELSRRNKRNDETYQEYTYKMLEIASQADLEPRTVIKYIIEGIPEDPVEKSILYGAKTIRQLKERFSQFEDMKSEMKSHRKIQDKKEDTIKRVSTGEKSRLGLQSVSNVKRCHMCGDKGHFKSECPNKQKGLKCFKCNEYGHIAIKCGSSVPKPTNTQKTNSISRNHTTKHTKEITITDVKLTALIDTVVDAFSKFVWLYTTRSTDTAEVLDKLRKQAVIFGNPRRIITDRGTAFTSTAFLEYCKEENIENVQITTGVPRSNGQVERVNRTIIPLLTKLAAPRADEWYKYLTIVQQYLNATPSRSTGKTPFNLLFGTHMRLKDDPEVRKIIEDEWIKMFEEQRDQLRVEAKTKIAQVQEENRRSFNKKRKKAITYKEGDLVAIKRTQFGPGLKVQPKYFGPYQIIRVLRNDRYIVEKIGYHEGPRQTSASADHIKPWSQDNEDDVQDKAVGRELYDSDDSDVNEDI